MGSADSLRQKALRDPNARPKSLECSNCWPWIHTDFWTGWRNLLWVCQTIFAKHSNWTAQQHPQNQEQKAKRLGSVHSFCWFPVGFHSCLINSTLEFNLNYPTCIKHKVRKSKPDTAGNFMAVSFTSLDFTSLGVVLILTWACNSSHGIKGFFCFVFTGDS